MDSLLRIQSCTDLPLLQLDFGLSPSQTMAQSALSNRAESSMSSDGGGLYFRKRKNSASWVIRRTRNKVASFTTIGRYPDMTLAAARQVLHKFSDTSAENMTVADLLSDWYDQNEKIWKRPMQMAGYMKGSGLKN